MIHLTGNNLGERQRELNELANDAFINEFALQDVIIDKEQSDVCYLLKINLASKLMKIRYLLEVLKCGDSLYISKALKCKWIYRDEYADVFNPVYLNLIFFPLMSMTMKRKLLTTIAIHLKNEERAAVFYEYCLKSESNNLALKYLLKTSEEYKINIIENNESVSQLILDQGSPYLQHFIGNSFALMDSYLKSVIHNDNTITNSLIAQNYLYSVSASQYLDLIERYEYCFYVKYGSSEPLGLRMTKSIAKKFKERILAKPKLYVKILNKKMLARQSSCSDAKVYLAGVLPDTSDQFWIIGFSKQYDYLINLIPNEEKFEFIKSIYRNKYLDSEFETTFMFYKQKYYNLMTVKEKEDWAFKHLEAEKEILGRGNNYVWYKFVNFDKAFVEIKEWIKKTPNKDKRAETVQILIESAKNNVELERLLQYYYERHVNENIYDKKNFLNTVLTHHNVFKFDANCWNAFEKLLYSIAVFNISSDSFGGDNYIVIALIYYIINKKELNCSLKEVLERELSFYAVNRYSTELGEVIQEEIYVFLFEYYVEKIKLLDGKNSTTLTSHIKSMLNLLENFNKTEKDVPKIVLDFIKLDWDNYMDFSIFKKHEEKELQASDLMRYLKKDKGLLVQNMPQLKFRIHNNTYNFNINDFLKKVRIYFSQDLAKDYVAFFQQLLTDKKIPNRVYYYAVHGIFQLSNEKFRNDFMIKYAPQESKINHSEIDRAVLYIQESICRFACFARPPVELPNMLLYLKGDYVPYCLPIFNTYVANLPLPQCLAFIESILDKPLSVQKHGLRLAFRCFDTENLKNVVLESWRKTKNVSLRELLYKSVFDKIVTVNDEYAQKSLFEVLKSFTNNLNTDDTDDVYCLLTNTKMLGKFRGEYLEVAWNAVNSLPEKPVNTSRKAAVIRHFADYIEVLPTDFVRKIINQHTESLFLEWSTSDLDKAKWRLCAKYIANYKNDHELLNNVSLLKTVLSQTIKKWDAIHNETYVMQEFLVEFIDLVKSSRDDFDVNFNPILKTILGTINSLPLEEVYMLLWDLKVVILARQVNNKDDNTVSVNQLAVGIRDLLNEYIENNTYCPSLLNEMADVVKNAVLTLQSHSKQYSDQKCSLLVDLGEELVTLDMTEIALIAIRLLVNYQQSFKNKSYAEKYSCAIKKLRTSENIQVRCVFYQTFSKTALV